MTTTPEDLVERIVSNAALTWCGKQERETFLEDITYFKCNWRALPGYQTYVLNEAFKELEAQRAEIERLRGEVEPLQKWAQAMERLCDGVEPPQGVEKANTVAEVAAYFRGVLARATRAEAERDQAVEVLQFVTRWAWREGVPNKERISVIKYHPVIKAEHDATLASISRSDSEQESTDG